MIPHMGSSDIRNTDKQLRWNISQINDVERCSDTATSTGILIRNHFSTLGSLKPFFMSAHNDAIYANTEICGIDQYQPTDISAGF